ncbi:hypothetical protein [Parerythrobacter aestuarii]|nr:hypothetical protein [Parerythrobacter aestuarii]
MKLIFCISLPCDPMGDHVFIGNSSRFAHPAHAQARSDAPLQSGE